MKRTQRGFTLTSAIAVMAVLAFAGLFAAKLMPSYLEYFAVQKVIKAMETTGELKGSVAEIRRTFNKRNVVENIQAITGEDLDVSKEGGEVIVTAAWSVKVPMVSNMSACLDFSVTNAK